MGTRNLPDMYALSPRACGPRALGIHIRQIPRAHVTTIKWNISKQEVVDTVDVLWAYGLVQFTDVTISPNNITQHCVEVHAVISQYIIECMDSNEVYALSPSGGKLNTAQSVGDGLRLTFQQSYGINDPL